MKYLKGFTLIESILVMSIIGIIAVGATYFVYWGSKLWDVTQDQVAAQESAREAMQELVGELREMQISDNGSHPIEAVSDNSITFYANIDSDNKREMVKYELDNGTLYKCTKESDDNEPPQYPDCLPGDNNFVAENIVNTGPMFEYYDDSYTGESAPLADPFDTSDIKLIKIKLLIDYDPGRTPVPLEIETNVALRNLKENL